MSEIERKLVGFRRRVRWLQAWRFLAIGGAAGAFLSVVLSALDFFRLRYFDWPVLVAPVLVGIGIGAIYGWLRRIPIQSLADSIDRRARLQNRLGTAAEDPATFAEEIKGDALAHLTGLKPSTVYPVRMTRWHMGTIIMIVLAASVFLLGNTPIFMSEQQRKDQEELKRIGQEVERVAKPLLEEKAEKLSPEAKELAKKYDELSKELKKGRMPKEEAMQKANDLAKEAEKMSKEQFAKSDESLAKAQDAMKQMALEQSMAESGIKPEDLGMSKEDIQQMSEQSEESLNQKAQEMSQEMNDLQRQLEAGKDAKGDPLSDDMKMSMKQKLDQLKLKLKALELSQKVKDFLKKLYSQPEFKEIMEMVKKLQETNAKGQQDQLTNPKMSEKEIEELQKQLDEMRAEMEKKLEELADKLKDDAEMKKFLEELKNSLKECKGG